MVNQVIGVNKKSKKSNKNCKHTAIFIRRGNSVKYTVNQITSFFMFANTYLHVTSQCHDVTSTLIAIQCVSLCTNIWCKYL